MDLKLVVDGIWFIEYTYRVLGWTTTGIENESYTDA